jgi:hypothetical protein
LYDKLSNDDFDELVNFIKNQTGTIDLHVTRESLIENDLGVTGDDASDLIQSFGKKYHVDISDFDFANILTTSRQHSLGREGFYRFEFVISKRQFWPDGWMMK